MGLGRSTNEENGPIRSNPEHCVAKTVSEMLASLLGHGCDDLRLKIDPTKYSEYMVAQGGFGDVWKGQTNDGKNVAVKVLRFAPMGDAGKKDLKRIMREIYYWSKLDHTNIHKLMGITLFRGQLGMVSEWMSNENLRSYLSQKKDLNHFELCNQIAVGVEYIHNKGMIHGDLKASNILVSSNGVIKITDFDYSLISDCSMLFTETTRVGGGTVRWMAPELFVETCNQRSEKTDIYALGMTFLEVFTGKSPYSPECANDPQVMFKVIQKCFPERSMKYFPQGPPGDGIWRLLTQCWCYDPAGRPTAQTVVEHMSMLPRWAETNMITATMPAAQILHSLFEHGCRDVSQDLDLLEISEFPVSGGRFGDVYCATLRNGDRVALKCLRMMTGANESGVQKHLKCAARELYAWSRCNHPNVLKLFGLVLFRNQIAMVSPWAEHGHLRWFISQHPQVDRYVLCTQITDGVVYLHKQGVVHGALKPENVLVREDFTPMLADFGDALLADTSLMFSTTTTQNISIRWTAPEILGGETSDVT